MKHSLNMGLAPGVCPLCRHDPCDCATVAPPLDLGQFEGYTEGDWAIGIETDTEQAQVITEAGEHIAYVACDPVLPNAHLIAHAPAILDRARELEKQRDNLERVALKVAKQRDAFRVQRDDLAGAVKYLLPRDDIRGGPNSECRCCGTRYLSSDAIKQHYKCNEPSCERAQARAALAKVPGGGDKEGGG